MHGTPEERMGPARRPGGRLYADRAPGFFYRPTSSVDGLAANTLLSALPITARHRPNGEKVRKLLTLAVLFFTFTSLSYAAPARLRTRCGVASIETLAQNPLLFNGQVFCGRVFVVEYGRTVRILRHATEMPPSRDLTFLVAMDTADKLAGLSQSPILYHLEARIDVQSECFSGAPEDEECVPYRRPVFMHILRAHRL